MFFVKINTCNSMQDIKQKSGALKHRTKCQFDSHVMMLAVVMLTIIKPNAKTDGKNCVETNDISTNNKTITNSLFLSIDFNIFFPPFIIFLYYVVQIYV